MNVELATHCLAGTSAGNPESILFGWEAGIRTPISRVRVCCPTVERPPSIGRTCRAGTFSLSDYWEGRQAARWSHHPSRSRRAQRRGDEVSPRRCANHPSYHASRLAPHRGGLLQADAQDRVCRYLHILALGRCDGATGANQDARKRTFTPPMMPPTTAPTPAPAAMRPASPRTPSLLMVSTALARIA